MKYKVILRNLLRNNYQLFHRSRLQVDFPIPTLRGTDRPFQTFHALNDVVVHRGSNKNVPEFEFSFGHNLSFPAVSVSRQDLIALFAHVFSKGDGIISSTATGSTGYSLSVGGPIIFPTADVVIVNMMSPRTLAFRPIIFPFINELPLKVALSPTSKLSQADIILDGRIVKGRLEKDQFIQIKKSPNPVPIFSNVDVYNDWHSKVTQSLHWGKPFTNSA